ncbi:hypothetical protein GTA51_10400 [Desulfovibrio aerotolerans]|uniref:ABC transporter substrate-binding protein n=1 Tax=Solidesulfovibrio aerotolerans TaxID=295255 RepID=A0A7C9ML71_9BACT|nr:ABC transporter substrate-binding protein [Solidesulfovibrio aerotolerans]MYL83533.1 hypothetical protein [Solidesulfovibrio aerotolerans]
MTVAMYKTTALLVLVLAAGGLAAWQGLVPKQPPRPLVIGVVQFTANNLDTLAGFQEDMAAAGFVAGHDVTYLIPEPATSATELRQTLDALLPQNPDLIFASPTAAAVAAKEATAQNRIPVIFGPVNDPVSSGVVNNIHQPEANLTGVRLAPSEGRRLQALLQLAPRTKTVFVPYNPAEASALASLRQIREAAAALGVELAVAPISAAPDFAINTALVPPQASAIFLPREGLVLSRFREFMTVAEARRLPMSSPRLDHVEQGVLTGYGFSGPDIGKQAARMARLALTGVKPSGIPVETARDYLAINLETAARIGLDVPESFLKQAQRIVVAHPERSVP